MKERKRVKELCGEFGVLCRVIFWLIAAYIAVLIIMGIWIGCHPQSDFSVSLTESVSGITGEASFTGMGRDGFAGSLAVVEFGRDVLSKAAQGSEKTVFLVGFAGRIASTAVILCIFWCLRRIFRNIDHFETPFCRENTRLIAWMGIWLIVSYYVQATVIPLFCMAFGFGGGNFTLINFAAFLLGAPLFFLSYVFEYGAVLQQDADETL